MSILTFGLCASLSVAALPFVPAPNGCSQAHCDAELSDQTGLPPPDASAGIAWRDAAVAGSNYALGCSSNGRRAACSFGLQVASGPYLVVYDASGQTLWSSNALGPGAASSAPVIDARGGVIAADSRAIIRFTPQGRRVWRHALPSQAGLPISPVVTSSGYIAYATTAGTVGMVRSTDGVGSTRTLRATIGGYTGTFGTRNTPAARGDRIYVVAEFTPDDPDAEDVIGAPARLYALDVSASGLDVAWFLDVGGRSGASPTVSGDVVFFDADQLSARGPTAPHFFAVRDEGASGRFVYKHPLTSPSVEPSGSGGALASAARDPRGGLWLFTAGSPRLVRLSESAGSGRTTDGSPTASVLTVIDLSQQLSRRVQPSSAVTIAHGTRGPVGMMTVLEGTRTRWLSVDLVTGRIRANVDLGTGLANWSAAQSATVTDSQGRSVVVLSTFGAGVVGLGATQ